jgi:formylmethanofuran dehydrogenase subunit E
MRNRIGLKEAEKFHGHLGPYLILGVIAGEYAINKLRCRRYFGLDVKVYGANRKPKSCLIDGLQLSTGATYGKGNIKKFNGSKISIVFCDPKSKKAIILRLKDGLKQILEVAKTHRDAEAFAQELYCTRPSKLFDIIAKIRPNLKDDLA